MKSKGFFFSFFRFALVTLAGVALPAQAGDLTVLNWQGYGTDEAWAVEIFAGRTGSKVVHDNFNSEQEMLTKLRTSRVLTMWC